MQRKRRASVPAAEPSNVNVGGAVKASSCLPLNELFNLTSVNFPACKPLAKQTQQSCLITKLLLCCFSLPCWIPAHLSRA